MREKEAAALAAMDAAAAGDGDNDSVASGSVASAGGATDDETTSITTSMTSMHGAASTLAPDVDAALSGPRAVLHAKQRAGSSGGAGGVDVDWGWAHFAGKYDLRLLSCKCDSNDARAHFILGVPPFGRCGCRH